MAKPGQKRKAIDSQAAAGRSKAASFVKHGAKHQPQQSSSSASSKGAGARGNVGGQRQKQQRAQQMVKGKRRSQVEEEDEEEDESSEGEEQDSYVDDDNSMSGSDGDSASDDEALAGATFTDENQAWLKPKAKGQQLLSSDDEGEEEEDDEEEASEEEDDEMLQLQTGDSDEEEEEDEDEEAFEEEEDEFDEEGEEGEEYMEGEGDGEGEEKDDKGRRLGLPEEMKERIEEVVEILSDFRQRRKPGVPRSEYMRRLARDLGEHYGYIPELTNMFLAMFSPAECVEFMTANDKPRPLVIRTNTLKARRKDLAQALVKRGVSLEPLSAWSKVALKIVDSQVPVGATPEYLAGHYILQSASSMQPVMALGPQPNEKVLDMSAAPGGKSSYCAQLMKNTGLLVCNDLKPERQKATTGNLHRLGVRNALIVSYDGRRLPQVMKGFDRVLLDAPCSGLGIVARDQSVKFQRTLKDIRKMSHLQKELLRAAVDCVDARSKTGGFVVYSTCSVSVEENEMVVDYILKTRAVKLVETGLEMGKEGFTRFQEHRFHPSLSLTRRFYPHVHNMDGFFVAKFKKLANQVAPSKPPKQQQATKTAKAGEGDDEEEAEEEEEEEEGSVDGGVDGQEEEAGEDSSSDEEARKAKKGKNVKKGKKGVVRGKGKGASSPTPQQRAVPKQQQQHGQQPPSGAVGGAGQKKAEKRKGLKNGKRGAQKKRRT